MKAITLVGLLLAGVSGCAVGPNYSRPAIEAPPAWRIDYPAAAEIANSKWWEQFGDPALDELIETALRDNWDVRLAAARVDQFIGMQTSTRAQLFPQIGYSADASRTRLSHQAILPPPPGVDSVSTYQATLGAAWQIDLFGRVRRLTEAAQAQVYASEQGRRGVVLTLVATVATSYVRLRALDRQLEIAQATASNYGETQRIFTRRFEVGTVSRAELAQIDSQYQQALAAIPAIEQAIAAQENLICVLEGRNPMPIARGRTIDQLFAPSIPADLPSTLLERRPDILAAEQNLVAATASVGAARALYFPTFSLTGALGAASTSFGSFFSGPASAWLVASSLTGPIFTFGGIEGQVQSAEAQREQALAFYQQTILNAFRETNDALVGSQKTIAQAQRQAQRVVSLRDFARLSHRRFEKGIAGYLEVLVAENDLFAAELASVSLNADRYSQLINVYQAMGGGWVDIAASIAPQARDMVVKGAP
jgi:multidrug efflux system outer membrane protein